jgi:3-hydroxy-D-aspartate aldolase
MNINNLRTPALIVDMDIFEKNVATMKEFIESTPMKLRPHYKTHKCTTIAHLQIAAGAKGISCAKLGEAEDLADAGIENILIANQVIELNKVAKVAHLANCCYLTVCVDNPQNIADLEAAAAFENSTIHCLVEYDIGMKRCGVGTPEEFYALAKQIADCPYLVFEGVQAYAGNLAHEVDYNTRKAESEKVEIRLRELISYMKDKSLPIKEVSGVSTGTVQLRPEDTVYTEAQPGSYIFMDASYNRLKLNFENSLFVLATVISANENFVSTDVGLKTVSVDQVMPVLHNCPAPLRMSEEHSTVSAEELKAVVGDRVKIIPGHCCTTINLHDYLYLTRNGKVIDKLPITSRGKSY